MAPALLAFGAPFGLSVLLTLLMRRLGPGLALMDEPGVRKTQAAPVALGGGLAIAGALAGAGALAWLAPASLGVREGLALRLGDLAWIALAAVLVLGVGIADDWRDLGPWTKLGAQALAAGITVMAVPEARISAFLPPGPFRIALGALWIIGVTNAFNLLDNMDGLSAGVAAIASALLAAVAFSEGRLLMGWLFLSLLGALAGFLAFNLPPASVYLGDAGSLLVGYILAVSSVLLTYDERPASLAPVGVPLLVFGVPLFDMATVMGIRLKEGRPLMRGDRSHLSHRLVALGMSPREAVGTIWLMAFALGLGALLLYQVPPEGAVLLLLQAAGSFAIIGLLERAARRKGGRP